VKRNVMPLACVVVLGLSSVSHASDPITMITEMVANSTPAAEHAGHGYYDAGTVDVNVFGGAFTGINNVETIYFGGASADWFFWDDLAVVTEFVGYGVNQEDRLGVDVDDSAGIGFNLLARWHLLKNGDETLALYIEGGAGLAQFNHRTPGPEGTHFNFTPQAGVGVKWKCADRIGIIAGVRYLHISNANIDGGDRNPGIDAIGGYGGITIDF